MTTHEIPLMPYLQDRDWWQSSNGHTGTTLRLPSRHQGGRLHVFSVLYIGLAGEGRREPYGPLIPGPWAALIGHASVIAKDPIPAPTPITVAIGDQLLIRNRVFDIRDDKPGHDPQLYLVRRP